MEHEKSLEKKISELSSEKQTLAAELKKASITYNVAKEKYEHDKYDFKVIEQYDNAWDNLKKVHDKTMKIN
jgi:hypothetical protein